MIVVVVPFAVVAPSDALAPSSPAVAGVQLLARSPVPFELHLYYAWQSLAVRLPLQCSYVLRWVPPFHPVLSDLKLPVLVVVLLFVVVLVVSLPLGMLILAFHLSPAYCTCSTSVLFRNSTHTVVVSTGSNVVQELAYQSNSWFAASDPVFVVPLAVVVVVAAAEVRPSHVHSQHILPSMSM